MFVIYFRITGAHYRFATQPIEHLTAAQALWDKLATTFEMDSQRP